MDLNLENVTVGVIYMKKCENCDGAGIKSHSDDPNVIGTGPCPICHGSGEVISSEEIREALASLERNEKIYGSKICWECELPIAPGAPTDGDPLRHADIMDCVGMLKAEIVRLEGVVYDMTYNTEDMGA